MPMAVMNIGEVRVDMRDRGVPVKMAVRLGAIPFEIVLMLVVRVVHMAMGMFHGLVRMRVLMAFGEVQPNASPHQSGRQPE